MPKYCSVPNCSNDSESRDEKKSLFKLPLHDPLRLQQWLRSMRRDTYTPNHHQNACHEHFDPSSFKMQLSACFPESDVGPTLFREVEQKRKAADQSAKPLKRARTSSGPELPTLQESPVAPDAATMESAYLFESVAERETRQVDSSHVPMHHSFTPEQLSQLMEDSKTESSFPSTFFKTLSDCRNSKGSGEFVLMSEYIADEGQKELLNGIAAAILAQGHGLLLNGAALGGPGDAWVSLCRAEESCSESEGQESQILAYVEPVSELFPEEITSQLMFVPETVMSSALSPNPISSIVPIVSNHATQPEVPVAVSEESVEMEQDECDGDDELSDDDHIELDDHQLEEHSYYKSSLSKEQLEVMVVQLKRKVKSLEQRHRLHLDKLVDLESTVYQLRQTNLLNEERLKLLEEAYLSDATVSDPEETVSIIYDDDDEDDADLYTPLREEV